MQALTNSCDENKKEDFSRPWDSSELQNLCVVRRGIENVQERKKISKQIWRKTRDQLRQHKTIQADEKFNEFSKLESFGKLHLYPIRKPIQLVKI